MGSAPTSTPTVPPTAAPIVAESGPPPWVLGTWRGTGTVSAVKLALPGNQGVQLSWVQDKGTLFVGPLDVNLTLRPDGSVTGNVSGSLGELSAVGSWDGEGDLHVELAAKSRAPDAFFGMLTLPFSTPLVTAAIRVASSDGRWVREAKVPMSLVK